MKTVMSDQKKAKLPQWVQQELRMLRDTIRLLTSTESALTAENQRLRNLVEDKFPEGDQSSDVYLINEDTGVKIPLDSGSTIRYGDYCEVMLIDHEIHGRIVHIETDNAMVMRETMSAQSILVDQEES